MEGLERDTPPPLPDGFESADLIGNTGHSLLFRSTDPGTGRPVLLEVAAGDPPAAETRAWLENHATIAHRLGGSRTGVVRVLREENLADRTWVVMEDPGVVPLEVWLAAQPEGRLGNVDRWLEAMLQLCESLEEVHAAEIVHKDLHPASILVVPEPARMILTGFGHATAMPREVQQAVPVGSLRGSLPFMAPEQTGRMARGIDTRSDLYALGALGFYLWAGQPPFPAKDPLELIHGHLARTPDLTAASGGWTPPIVERIVLRLMQKEPGDRYQSAAGLAADLRRFIEEPDVASRSSFELDRLAPSTQLKVSDVLSGRHAEVELLRREFEAARSGPTRLALLRGPSGIGKTALVQELQGPVLEAGGIYVEAKFEQYQLDIPFAGICRALRMLVRWLVQLPEADFAASSTRLREALGDEGGVMTELEPALERVLDVCDPPPAVPGPEAIGRQARVVRQFFGCLASEERPLVLVLDDMQWADGDSIRLLQAILEEGRLRGVLIVLCYRDDELPAGHPLLDALQAIRAAGRSCCDIEVGPLSEAGIQAMLKASLGQPADELVPLMRIHSQGSPLYVRTALESLFDHGALTFDIRAPGWTIDADRARSLLDHEGVDALVRERLDRVAPEGRHLLALASALGSRFTLADAAALAEWAPKDAMPHLRAAVRAGIVDLVRGTAPGAESTSVRSFLPELDPSLFFVFRHDRLQQAAYGQLDAEAREQVHERIGRRILERTSIDSLDEEVLTIVGHLNQARSRLRTEAKRHELAELNARASGRARSSGSFGTASRCAQVGLSLLGDAGWDKHRALALELHTSLAESAALTGDLKALESAARAVAEHAAPSDRLRAQKALVLGYAIQGRMLDAVEAAREGLTWFGVHIPVEPTPDDVGSAFGAAMEAIGDRDPMQMVDLPLLTDSEQLAIHELSGTLSAVAYIVNQSLFAWIMLRALERFAKHGNPPDAAFFYGCAGVILMALTKDPDRVMRFGELALALAEKAESRGVRGMAYFIVGASVSHWTRPYAYGIDLLTRSRPLLLEAGNLEFAGYASYNVFQHKLLAGLELRQLEREANDQLEELRLLRIGTSTRWLAVLVQLARNLIEGTEDADSGAHGEFFDAEREVPALHERGDHTGLATFHVFSLLMALVSAAPKAARRHLELARPWQHGLGEFPPGGMFHFMQAVVLLREDQILEADRPHLDESLRLLEIFASGNPEIYGPKLELVRALSHVRDGAHLEALAPFERAVEGARRAGMPFDEGLAAEFAHASALAWGKPGLARDWARVAARTYAKWGAAQAAARMQAALGEESTTPSEPPEPSKSRGLELDVQSFLKASEISGRKLELDHMPTELLKVAMENAGATSGALVHRWGSDWWVRIAGPESASVPLPENQLVPEGVLNEALNGQQTVIVEDVSQDPVLGRDERLLSRGVRCLLCMPVHYAGNTLGAIYLENALVSRAFLPGRIDALRVLCTQTAVSLQNALLFQGLRASEERLRAIVSNNIDIITILDERGNFQFLSPSMQTVLGYDPDALLGRHSLEYVHPEDLPHTAAALERLLERPGKREELQLRFQHADGHWRHIEVAGQNYLSVPGVDGILINTRDISDRLDAEMRLHRAERLDAIGQLTGGVAHDFNNLLTVITGNLEMLAEELPAHSEDRLLTEQALRAAERGATLTRSLLAFARRQPLQPQDLDLGQVVADLKDLIRRTLPENISLELTHPSELPACRADVGQLQNVLLNLVVNARDAMPRGGRLEIRLGRETLDADAAAREQAVAGTYVALTVADTGRGMSEAVRARVFEPFFTTKGPDKGSGLGLSMVYGFARQSGGAVRLRSEVDVGTEVTVLLPQASQAAAAVSATASVVPMGSQETVLVVEDDSAVLSLVGSMLRSLQYEVLDAHTVAEAEAELSRHPEIRVVLSDVILPGDRNGTDLISATRDPEHPRALILMSGYAEEALLRSDPGLAGVKLLQKPFNRQELGVAMREAMPPEDEA